MPAVTAAQRLLFFAGSSRAGSHNKKLAWLGHAIARANGIEATLLDLGDFPMPLYDGDLESRAGVPEPAHRLKGLMLAHGGVFIACPEYNASVTPLLKNTIDWLSHVPPEAGEATQLAFKARVFALGSASTGGMGGLRGLNTVRQCLELGLRALVLPDQFALPRAHEAFGEDGHLGNKDSQANLEALIQKLAHVAHVLHG